MRDVREPAPVSQSRDSIADVWGPRTPHAGAWPVRVDQRTVDAPERWVQSACVLCSTGCGMDIGVKDGRIVGVRGRTDDRVNHGRLGPKGLHGWEANASADRLMKPLIRRGNGFEEATWDDAMALITERAMDLRARYGGGSLGFYNSGQLFIEDYYTLSIMATAGIGTLHVDANTRLCTATAATAFIESFGTDGPPGSYEDFDVTDAIMLFGHNMAATQTVLWSRVLDRLEGPRRPRLLVVDPRTTASAKRADLHLTPRIGTNVPLLNGVQHLLIKHGWIDRAYIEAHTVGYEHLERVVRHWPPERVAAVTGLPAGQIEAAAELIGTSPTLVSTTLQGVFQSPQATAAAVQVNNMHLLRGMIGKPGCTVFQMNGQPTSQNTRECGCNGELIAFRNWENIDHIREQARIWNVEPDAIPHWSPPTHAMQIFRYAEAGSIRFLWVIGTNPAVSLPELHRIREVLARKGLFLVVEDAFMTETARYADVVLPAAIWGEKTGCFTNADRTVHISHKAIEPPGEARPDMDIFIDFSRRMGFEDKDGAPLIKWSDPEACFEAWKECSRGRPCDYSGLSYAKLTGGSGIKWPGKAELPQGPDRR
jgi:anaerobic selenocysteine-containing dehydrogenase